MEKGTVGGSTFDDGVNHAGHLGGNGCERFTLQIRICRILGDVARILVSETVFPLANGDIGCHPERTSQTGIAKLGKLGLSPECT